MTPQQFEQFARAGYRLVPVTRRILADLDTPVSVYAKLAKGRGSYLLESVENVENWGRFSIIGLPGSERISVYGQEIRIERSRGASETLHVGDPLVWLRGYVQKFNVPELENLPRFAGGLVGYFGYDTVRYTEARLANSQPPDDMQLPDICLLRSEELAIFDNFAGTLDLVVHLDTATPDAWNTAQTRLDELESQLQSVASSLPPIHMHDGMLDESVLVSDMGKPRFMAAVERIREYALDGDIMQVVLAHRMKTPYAADPFSLYRALRTVNPSPYMYFLDFGEFQVAGASPEILVRLEKGQVTVRPIAGTRKRGKTEEEDLRMEAEMRADPKEIAEHLMLIDLGRNDCGRIARTGTVEVTEQMVVERFPHVMHMTSNVIGEIAEGLDAIDALRAIHPAGTLSGAPKVRAMEIIDELEPTKRGIYGGAVGYIGWDGDMDTAIAIRTAVITDGVALIQSGAGIVADSQPELEWKETMNKARALLRAISLVSLEPKS